MNRREVFLIEDRGRTALFAPYVGLIMEVSKDEKEITAALIRQPQFSFRDLVKVFPEINNDRLLLRKAEMGNVIEKKRTFSPDSAVLLTTTDCNLRCIYCYANAGEQRVSMNQQTAKATIDFIVRNAKSKEQKRCSLGFHGGGEPTLNWSVFQFAVSYFQEKTQENELVSEIDLATNGMLSRKQIDWIAQHISVVQVSLDGTREIQNFQRPTVGKGKSFTTVCNTIKSLQTKGVRVLIHSVVTEKSVRRISEIIRFLVTNFPDTTIHLEPASKCGRGLTTDQQFPSSKLFVKGLIEAQKIAERFGVEVLYSGADPGLVEFRESFCGVSVPSFIVTPTGLVTACYEVAELAHPLAEHFIYGYLDNSDKHFVFDYQKIEKLRSLGMEIDPRCEECFAHPYCVGDCLAKSLNSRGERSAPFLNPRCMVNQELVRRYVFNRLFSTRKEDCREDASGRRKEQAADCLPQRQSGHSA